MYEKNYEVYDYKSAEIYGVGTGGTGIKVGEFLRIAFL